MAIYVPKHIWPKLKQVLRKLKEEKDDFTVEVERNEVKREGLTGYNIEVPIKYQEFICKLITEIGKELEQ